MILGCPHAITVGKVYRSGEEGAPYAITDVHGKEQYEFAILVMRESTREEYLEYWTQQGNREGAELIMDTYFYLVSMD